MISTWKNRRQARRAKNKELTIPSHFRCPISLDLMKDPVTLSTGITYDRDSIEGWINERGNVTCPITNQVLINLEPVPNHSIRRMIQDWCVDNKSHGIERIPTPRIPISSMQVTKILEKIEYCCANGDATGCKVLVGKIRGLMKESERNKRCILGVNGIGKILSCSFKEFSKSFDKNHEVLEELLLILVVMFPLDDEEAMANMGSFVSLNSILCFLKSGDLTLRKSSILVLKEIISSDHKKLDSLIKIEGFLESLVKLIKEPICSGSTKASLMIIYHLTTSEKNTLTKFIDMGLVPLLIEAIVDGEKSLCEKGLGVVDKICREEIGRAKAYEHALIVPVLVKKILRVSELATEFCVSILWKMCKNEKRNEGNVVVEALQFGLFQKLLLMLQVGCDERTRMKASELLKMMNFYRERAECVDSMDFKQLKRPF